jgi:hypothetical protein
MSEQKTNKTDDVVRSRPFSTTRQTVVQIQRVRISQGDDFHWNVEYLPAGKSRWWWNWRVYKSERTEQSARLLADVLASEKVVSLTGYAANEVEL